MCAIPPIPAGRRISASRKVPSHAPEAKTTETDVPAALEGRGLRHLPALLLGCDQGIGNARGRSARGVRFGRQFRCAARRSASPIVLGIVTDGVVGADTLRAIARADAAGLIRQLTNGRLTFLARLPTWPVFGRGWRKRVLSVEQDALRLILESISNFLNKDTSMIDFRKTILSSRTVWSNLIGLAALGLGLLGLDATGLESPAFADAIAQVVAAGGFIASTVFRIVATKQFLN